MKLHELRGGLYRSFDLLSGGKSDRATGVSVQKPVGDEMTADVERASGQPLHLKELKKP